MPSAAKQNVLIGIVDLVPSQPGKARFERGAPNVPATIVPGAALVTIRWGLAGRQGINVLGASIVGVTSINQALAETLDTGIKSAFTTNLAAQIASNCSLISVGIRDIRTANLAEFVGSGAFVVGTAVGDALPTGNALCITLRTARAGQSFRGRVYLGGFSEASNESQAMASTATVTAAVNFITAVSGVFTSNGLSLAVVSRPSERRTIVTTTFHADGTQDVDTVTLNARAGQVTPVTGIAGRNAAWDSQRRRSSLGSESTLLMGPVAQSYIGESGSTQVLENPRGSRK